MLKNLIPGPVARIFEIFEREGIQIYLVGGTVREMLRGSTEELNDFDFATPTSADETAAILRKAGMKPIPVGMAFGTVGAVADGVRADITTFRREEQYRSRSRHPEVGFGGTIEEDLERRDFCMNAIAMTKSGEILDPYNGAADIEKKGYRFPATRPKYSVTTPFAC